MYTGIVDYELYISDGMWEHMLYDLRYYDEPQAGWFINF